MLATVAPVAVEYVLTPQSRHVAATDAPVAVEYFPAPQSVHAALPMVVLNLPVAHNWHDCVSGPVEPTSHTVRITSSGSSSAPGFVIALNAIEPTMLPLPS